MVLTLTLLHVRVLKKNLVIRCEHE